MMRQPGAPVLITIGLMTGCDTPVALAYATSQIEGGRQGVPVRTCLRPGNQGLTEFRVLSTEGKVLSEWRSIDLTLPDR
jgi:hypothetical protein